MPTTSILSRTAAVVMTALCSAACGTAGAMGQVQTSAADGADKGGLASALEAPLAVGGEVRPTFRVQMKGSSPPRTHLVPARRDIVDVRDGVLIGKSPGLSAVLVADDDETVLDFVHVSVRAADRLAVHGIDGNGSDMGPLSEPIELLIGEGVRLVPHAYSSSDQLVGVGTSSWVVDPPIAVILREGLPNRVRLVARKPGAATVKVTMLGATSTLNLKVIQ